MLRNQIRVLGKIFPRPAVFYSTTVASRKKQSEPTLLIQRLSSEFGDISPVLLTLKKNSAVKNIHFDEWKNRINLLNRYQFSYLECFQIISGHLTLLEKPLSKFEGSLQQWFCSDLGFNNFYSVLMSAPILLDVSQDVIKNRVPKLRVYFRTSEALALLLINCPNVMFDNFESVVEKINYLLNVRGYKIGDVVLAKGLLEPLDFIKFRFDLLEKCGVYKQETKPYHKINEFDKSKHKNPSLKSVLLTSTQDFVKIAKISEEEYEVCKDLFYQAEDDEIEIDNYK